MAWESMSLKGGGHNVFKAMPVTPLNVDTTQTTRSSSSDNTTSSSSASSSPSVCSNIERFLSNGDLYIGQWGNNRPHGTGKYLWKDGSMYEGEWYQGKTMGHGKFSWPSGATYEGEFKSGNMDGIGTFTGASGDTYIGQYIKNEKHGKGTRTYVNGDCYDGDWKNGTQDGQGKYVWRNQHVYNGSWKGGLISGYGVLTWANGNSYDGEWEEGYPCGKGQYRWADGGYYVGVWSRHPVISHQGIYHPPSSSASSQRDPQVDLLQALGSCKICPGESVPSLPYQKSFRWSDKLDALWPSNGVRTSCMTPRQSSNGKNGTFAWGVNSIFHDKNDNHNSSDGGRSGNTPWVPRGIKKQGEAISKNHKNYELMLNLQLGIRYAVGKPAPVLKSLDLKASVFDPKQKVWTKFPTEGSKNTPPHQSCDFKWKDYCPVVFRTLRTLMFKVDAGDYMLSICGNDALRELSSPGKSGSFFYLTHDDRYMIKTVKKAEVKVLIKMLPAYYNHVRAFKNTLVTKFFGLHCVKLTGTTQKKVRFVIMGNLFCSEYPIHKRFDLKGSSHGRTTSKPESEIDETTTLKDNDLNFIFRLRKSWFLEFQRQVDRDCDFLEQEKIMDYSLLVGLHFRDSNLLNYEGSSSETSEGTPRMNRADMDQLLCDPNKWASIKLGINMPAKVEQTMNRRSDYSSDEQTTSCSGGGEIYDVVLFFGIIDILQDYDISKKLEHAYKSMHYDASSISAVDPKQYAKRFREFIFKIFSQDI